MFIEKIIQSIPLFSGILVSILVLFTIFFGYLDIDQR